MISPRPRRRTPTTVTPYMVEQVRQLSEQNLLQGQIAQRLNIATSTVASIQRSNHFKYPSRAEGRAISLARSARA